MNEMLRYVKIIVEKWNGEDIKNFAYCIRYHCSSFYSLT
jgi:hypothetical protein